MTCIVLTKGFQADESEIAEAISKLGNNAREVLFTKVKDTANHLRLRMEKKFEDSFR